MREARPGAVIRVDANTGWSVEQALEAAQKLGALDYLEQPCATVEELAQVRAHLQRRGIFARVADESIRRSMIPTAWLGVQRPGCGRRSRSPAGQGPAGYWVAQYLRPHDGCHRGQCPGHGGGDERGPGCRGGPAQTLDDDDLLDVAPAAAGLATSSSSRRMWPPPPSGRMASWKCP